MTSVNASKRPGAPIVSTSAQQPTRRLTLRLRAGLIAASFFAVAGVGTAAVAAPAAAPGATQHPAVSAEFHALDLDGGPWPWKRPV